MGARARWLAAGRAGLATLADGPLRPSPVVETAPWGLVDQPPFLNQVVGFRPRFGPHRTLAALQAIERACGRRRVVHWGPRMLDLDLLDWPTAVAPSVSLTVPHPRFAARRFVLEPWARVAPEQVVLGRSVRAWLAACSDSSWVRWR